MGFPVTCGIFSVLNFTFVAKFRLYRYDFTIAQNQSHAPLAQLMVMLLYLNCRDSRILLGIKSKTLKLGEEMQKLEL